MANIDYLIIGIFLLALLLLGFVSSKKVSDIKDYAIANKTYATVPVLLTMLATMIGGDDTTGDVDEFFSNGIIYAVPYIGFIISLILIAKYVAPKFDKRFEGMISVGDIMDSFYGKKVAFASGIIGTIATLGYASAQSIALGHLVSSCMNLDYKISVIIASSVVMCYTMIGGIRSVIITDILQFSLLIVMIPIICNVSVANVGGLFDLIQKIPDSHINIKDNQSFGEHLALLLIWVIPINALFPPMIQRFLMCRSSKQISHIMYVYAAILSALLLMMICLAFSALVLYPNINGKEVIPHIITNLLPHGIRGLAVVGMMSVIMSTLDSNLNSAAILFTQNILRSKNLKVVKGSTLILGLGIITVASLDLTIINVIVFVQSILAVGVGIPLFCGIMGIEATPRDFWICLICSVSALIVSTIYLKEINYISSFITILVGGISFFISSYVNTRWSKKWYCSIRKMPDLKLVPSIILTYATQITKKVPKLFNLVEYSNKSVKEYGAIQW